MKRVLVFLIAAVLLVPVLGCAGYVRNPDRIFGATNFQWTGDPVQPGDVILVDFFVREDGTAEWIKIFDDVVWTDLEGAVEAPEPYTLLPDTKIWYRVDVQATIDGEYFQYSCVSDDWLAVWSLSMDCYEREAD